MLNDFAEKKETFFGYKQNFSKSEKSHFFLFCVRFYVYLDLEKIRLKIMLTDFHREKKPFRLQKGIPKNPLFQRG